MQRRAVLVLVLVACKSESKAPPLAKEPAAPDAIHEIAKQPRTPIAGKTGFLEFTIELPTAASRPLKGERETSWMFKDSKLDLQVREVSTFPTEGAAKAEPPPMVSKKLTRAKTDEPGAYLIVDRTVDATAFALEYCRDLDPNEPPSGICCAAKLTSEAPLDDLDALIRFGDQVCRSIKVTNRKPSAPGGSAQ